MILGFTVLLGTFGPQNESKNSLSLFLSYTHQNYFSIPGVESCPIFFANLEFGQTSSVMFVNLISGDCETHFPVLTLKVLGLKMHLLNTFIDFISK